jgi:hypothetical protein
MVDDLQVDLSKRYGCLVSGVNDVKSHPWLRSIDWVALRSGKLEPPIRSSDPTVCSCCQPCHADRRSLLGHHVCVLDRPVVKSADDTSNFEEYKLGPTAHMFELSAAEQVMFEGI